MKKSIIGTLAAAVLVLLLVPAQGGAVTVSAGPAAFYSWWVPAFKDHALGKSAMMKSLGQFSMHGDFNMKPSFLIGPSVSVTLPAGFSVSAVFLYGSWYSGSSTYWSGTTPFKNEWDAVKWDLDVLVNYTLNRYLKLFCGFKYQGYTYDYLMNYAGNLISLDGRQEGWGPGLGASVTINLWGPLYLLTNASVLYLSTNIRFDSFMYYRLQNAYNVVGFNGTTSLAWYIEPASVTVSLGFRYQYLHYMLDDGRTNDWYSIVEVGAYPNRKIANDDHFYGITLAAIYSLNL